MFIYCYSPDITMLEKNELFKIMREQNYWHGADLPGNYVQRVAYLENMNESLSSNSITVVKGPRRAGKTVLIHQTIKTLLKNKTKKEQTLYVNLEDYRFYTHYSLELLEVILDTYREKMNPDEKAYVFFDEIQNIEGFERFLRTKLDQLDNIKFIITSSNAKLLSKELGTLLTGRITSIEVLPFSFREYLDFHKIKLPGMDYFELEPEKSRLKKMLNRYVEFGAIPEFLSEPNSHQRLVEYFENVLFRDIVERFNIRNVKLIKELAIYLASNASNLYSVNRIGRTFNASVNTIQSYLFDLNMAYLFFYVSKFSYSYKDQVSFQSKSYCLDTGLLNAMGFKFSEDRGRLLENLVFIELLRRGKEVYYHRDPATSRECDFIIKGKLKVAQALQVTESLSNEKTKKRELNGLIDAMECYSLSEGMILTDDEYDDVTHDDFKIAVRPVWFWLLNEIA